MSHSTRPKPVVAISACLLGEQVRYDGGHKAQPDLIALLEGRCELLSLCPEVGAGLGVPRPPVRLVGEVDEPRAIGVDDPSLDVTGALLAYAARSLPALAGISGAILKSRSPSCGLAVEVEGSGTGRGLFAAALIKAMPEIPVTNEESLRDPAALEEFLRRLSD